VGGLRLLLSFSLKMERRFSCIGRELEVRYGLALRNMAFAKGFLTCMRYRARRMARVGIGIVHR
jgi:hypothetical protein